MYVIVTVIQIQYTSTNCETFCAWSGYLILILMLILMPVNAFIWVVIEVNDAGV